MHRGLARFFFLKKDTFVLFWSFVVLVLFANHLTLTQLYLTKHTLPHTITVENQNDFSSTLANF